MDENLNINSEEPVKHTRLQLYWIALIIEGTTVLSALMTVGTWSFVFLEIVFFFGALLFIWTFIAPLIGIVLGIVSLCTLPRTKKNIICSTVAIALPITVVVLIILLFSTGVLIISFM